MGTGVTEITLAQLPGVIGRYSNVLFFNDPSDTDLLKTLTGHPGTILINLGQFLNIADGEIQGDALAADELTAAEIGAGAVDTDELAAGCLDTTAPGRLKMVTGYFNAVTLLDKVAANAVVGSLIDNNAVGFPFGVAAQNLVHDAANVVLLAADGTIDRVVTVMFIGTEVGDGTVELDIGVNSGNEVFDDLAAGAWAVGERYVGTVVLPAGATLDATFNVAGGTGEGNAYVLAVTPLVQTAQIADDAVTNAKVLDGTLADAKLASTLAKDVGALANGVCRITGVIVDGETITIGADTYEADQIDGVSGDTCDGNDFNDATDPWTVDMNAATYVNIGQAGVTPLVVGALIFIGTEYLRVTGIAGDDVTFERGACGSTPAAHVGTTAIFDSVGGTVAPGSIPVGHQGGGDLAAAVMTPLIVGSINEANLPTEDVSAVSLATGAILLLVADAVGVNAQALGGTHGNAVWDDGNMRRGAAAAVRQIHTQVIDIDTEEDTADILYIPLPFTPVAVQVMVTTDATGAVVLWNGDVIINAAVPPMPAYIELNNDGAQNWANTDSITILAIS